MPKPTLRLFAAVAMAAAFSTTLVMPASAHKSSAFVLDATTGRTLYSRSGDARRYPASLTKMMTLYLLFEDIEGGRVTLTTPFHVSAHAAAQAPSKLWLKPGQTITVLQAIRAIVTLSANDVAAVIAENLEGSEATFASRMTRMAHWLGMENTQFRNASGLPDPRQYTTARDMAILGAALQARFPAQYRYFRTRKFVFRKRIYRNHNHLLRMVRGVDGIKTGYTRASGFNVVTSQRRSGRKLIAVVMGGRTYKARDTRTRALLQRYFVKARRGKHYYADLLDNIRRANANAKLASVTARASSATTAGRYAIQVGALPTKQAARSVIEAAEPYVLKILDDAKPELQPAKIGDTTIFRAIFNGFEDSQAASAACAKLRKRQFPCYYLLRAAEIAPE